MIINEVQDSYELDVEGLKSNYHVFYEKVCKIEPMFNGNHQMIGEKQSDVVEEISVYQDNGSISKKVCYQIGKDVNNVSEALGLITHLYVNKLSA